MAKRRELNRIKVVLEEQGKTQSWLAAQMNVEFRTINRYVSNQRQPSLEKLFEIAKILKVSTKELIKD